MLRKINFSGKRWIFIVICHVPQILQCLSAQGLTSSGGGSSNPSVVDGGNSSGASRALVKDRLVQDIPGFLCMIFLDLNQHKSLKVAVIYLQVQDFQYAVRGASSEAISVDSS